MNIDKDIERCKNLIGYVGCELREIEANSIENVLSELETQINNTHILQSQLDVANAEKIEWKKIAEKLADKLEQYGFPLMTIRTSENELGLKEPTKEELIDWARKEVENEKNNSNN